MIRSAMMAAALLCMSSQAFAADPAPAGQPLVNALGRVLNPVLTPLTSRTGPVVAGVLSGLNPSFVGTGRLLVVVDRVNNPLLVGLTRPVTTVLAGVRR